MKAICFRFPVNIFTDILLSLLCICVISLILTGAENLTVQVASVNDGQILSFLEANGIEIDKNTLSQDFITLPEIPDETMRDYICIQQKQGLGFEDYLGKNVMKYTAEVLNYPDEGDVVYVCVFTYKGEIIGADIHSVALEGFMHGVIQ